MGHLSLLYPGKYFFPLSLYLSPSLSSYLLSLSLFNSVPFVPPGQLHLLCVKTLLLGCPVLILVFSLAVIYSDPMLHF